MPDLSTPSRHLIFCKLFRDRIKFRNSVLAQHIDPHIVVFIDRYAIWLTVAVRQRVFLYLFRVDVYPCQLIRKVFGHPHIVSFWIGPESARALLKGSCKAWSESIWTN